MSRGLVIGKFMPLHKGHIALIEFAASNCDELIVSMTYMPDDPIPGAKRFEWIKQEFRTQKNIHPEISLDDFDIESLPLTERIPRWAAFLRKRFPKIDLLFSSEEYGEPLAQMLGAIHIPFDPERKKFPVSASMIRTSPFRHWDFIANAVRPYFVKKICFYGPESTGKSSLAVRMAAEFKTEFVPEVSRELITTNDFSLQDIIRIGNAQTSRVLEKTLTANRFLFCDTDLITTQIYCRHYLGQVPPVLLELERKVSYDRYFLFDIDVPWVADGLRDLGTRRLEMFQIFRSELESRQIPYALVKGDWEQREQFVRNELTRFVKLYS